MRVLVVSATEFEVGSLKSGVLSSESSVSGQEIGADIKTNDSGLKTIDFLVTGVGMVATAFSLGRHLAQNQYDLAINLGIAGSFDRNIALGEVVEITVDTLSELGAEDDENFLSIEQLGFGEGRFSATAKLEDYYTDANLRKTTAITVNTIHGNDSSIQKLTSRIDALIESMEGAAFFYACQQMNVPCLQIRSVSNYVEKRNRYAWQIGLAIKNLNTFAAQLLLQLSGY